MKLLVVLYFLAALLQLVGQVEAATPAQPKLLCASYYVYKYKSSVERLPTDKTKHCTLSCYLTRKCGGNETAIIGYLKEFADLLGFGNAEWNDIRANRAGIEFGKVAGSNYACKRHCLRLYPKLRKKR